MWLTYFTFNPSFVASCSVRHYYEQPVSMVVYHVPSHRTSELWTRNVNKRIRTELTRKGSVDIVQFEILPFVWSLECILKFIY